MPGHPDFSENSSTLSPAFCAACGTNHGGLARRQFLCTGAAGAAAVPAIAASFVAPAAAQPAPAQTPGRAILLKDGCVLSLDRAVGDFEKADVLIEGTKI